MNAPSPVSLSPQMIAILAKSKQVMNKSLNDKPIINKNVQESVNEAYSYDTTTYDERDERDPEYAQHAPSEIVMPQNFDREHIMASKLPQNIKEAMINNPIAKVNPLGVSQEVIEAINPNSRKSPAPQPRQVVNENRVQNNSDMITISRSELQEMINTSLMTFLKTNYEKALTESAITKTINLLIKEGKITVKKKIT